VSAIHRAALQCISSRTCLCNYAMWVCAQRSTCMDPSLDTFQVLQRVTSRLLALLRGKLATECFACWRPLDAVLTSSDQRDAFQLKSRRTKAIKDCRHRNTPAMARAKKAQRAHIPAAGASNAATDVDAAGPSDEVRYRYELQNHFSLPPFQGTRTLGMDIRHATYCLVQGRAAKRSRVAGASVAGPATAHEDTDDAASDSDDGGGSEQDEVDFEPEIVEDDRRDFKVRCMQDPEL
jgi:hypothetical protein